MPATRSASPSGPLPQEIARQWFELAERRLAYYNDLYRSGRWRHYYDTEERFAVRMLDVIKAAKNFARIAGVTAELAAAPAAQDQDLRPAA